MEFNINHHENDESMSSREELEQENTSVGRFYDCVFCKRGFKTAQALGGHMNIHRKDRSRNKSNTSPSKQQESYIGPRFYQQIPISRNGDSRHSTYFAGTSTHLYGNPQQQDYSMNHFDHDSRRRTDQLIDHGDWRMRLDYVPTTIGEDLEKNHEQELDLELRLGF